MEEELEIFITMQMYEEPLFSRYIMAKKILIDPLNPFVLEINMLKYGLSIKEIN